MAIPAHAAPPKNVGPQGCALPTSPSSCVNSDPAGLTDTAEPGSVLVFPKFKTGSVTVSSGAVEPQTQIEIAAVCNSPLLSTGVSPTTCPSQTYTVHVHWVCPPAAGSTFCASNDFDVELTTYGKVVFNPGLGGGVTLPTSNGRITGYPGLNGTTPVQPAPCGAGYALAWVVANDSTDTAIAADVLIGDAIIRNGNGIVPAVAASDLQSYSALAIQSVSDNGEETGGQCDGCGPAPLVFDGTAGNYQMPTGQFWGDIRFNQDATAPFADTQLILLTLDVQENSTNPTTNVDLEFYDATETGFSTFTSFICWKQISLTNIDPALTIGGVGGGAPNGVVVTGQAFQGPSGSPLFVSLFGLIQTVEGPSGSPLNSPPNPAGVNNSDKSYTVRPSNNSIPVATTFFP